MGEKKKYWYSFYIKSCPVCGSTDTYKIREYTPKPEDYNKRYEYAEVYDWCFERYV